MVTKSAPKKSAKNTPPQAVAVKPVEKTAAQVEADRKAAKKAEEKKRREALRDWVFSLVDQLDLPTWELDSHSADHVALGIKKITIILLDAERLMGPVALQLAKHLREFAEELNRKAASLEAIQAATVAATTAPEDEDEDEDDQDEGDQDE